MIANQRLNRPEEVEDIEEVGGGGVREMKRNRRALSVINQNWNLGVGSQQQQPSFIPKKSNSQNHCVIYQEENTNNHHIPPSNPIQRPITRKFAAQNVNVNVLSSQHPKKSNEIDCCKPSPMSLEKPQQQQEEQLQEVEVEMEDIFDEDEEPILNIDGRDSKDPLAVTEYIDDLYLYYRKMESCSTTTTVSSDYMSRQFDINEKMRAILIDWLIEVHYKFELRDETLFLTVNLLDRFLALHNVVRKKLQLVGLIAMLLACKYEEVSVPVVEDLILISDKAYTRQDLLDMERLMLRTLQFNMSLPTAFVFLTRFLKAAQADTKLEQMCLYLIELSLVEYEMTKFQPSLLAASAVYTAQCTLYGFRQWNKTCEFYTNYSENQLLECSRLMVTFHQSAGTGKLTGVHRKYSTSKFGYAARFEPALFLLQD